MSECPGHESTTGPAGISVKCDGTCQQRDPRLLDPIDEAFIITEAKILDQSAVSLWSRRRMEIAVVRALLKTLAADGWTLSVDDGGEEGEEVTGTLPELMAAVFSVDDAHLFAMKDGR